MPVAPARLSREGGVVGLSFLETALRQNHVRRITEYIKCFEAWTAERRIEVDVSLTLLEPGQREASKRFQEMRLRARTEPVRSGTEYRQIGPRTYPHPTAFASEADAAELARHDIGETLSAHHPETVPISGPPSEAGGYEDTLWLPIARMSRREIAPVSVHDATGSRIPLLTQFETSRLLASGMYRLLRSILRSGSGDYPTYGDLHSGEDEARRLRERQRKGVSVFLNRRPEARWLVQSGLLSLLTEQGHPDGALGDNSSESKPFEEVEDPEKLAPRDLAVEVLKTLSGSEYDQLLWVALADYILIVGIDPRRDEQMLNFSLPLSVIARRKGGIGPYRVHYTTTAPANIRSYHLMFEAEDGVAIRGMALSSDADKEYVRRLAADMKTASSVLRGSQPPTRYEKAEIGAVMIRASELMRRRLWEVNQARLPVGPGDLEDLRVLSNWSKSPAFDDQLTKSKNRAEIASCLDRVQVGLAADDYSIGKDLYVENDPSGSSAHAYWRRVPSRRLETNRITLNASMAFVDATGTRPGVVSVYALGVLANALLVLWALSSSPPWDLGHSLEGTSNLTDAAVAILLLVPGFLYYKLDLPDRSRVSGRLRRLPRFVALSCLVSMVVLATVILSQGNLPEPQAWVAGSLLIPLAGYCAMWGYGYYNRHIDREAWPSGRPAWVRVDSGGRGRASKSAKYDLLLSSDPVLDSRRGVGGLGK